MKKINEDQKVTLTFGQLKRLVKESLASQIRESIGESDEELALGMAKDIINNIVSNDDGDFTDSIEDDLILEYFDDNIDVETKPTRHNIDPSGANYGEIWTYWWPGSRYNNFEFFDKALKAKTGIDYQTQDEDEFYTLENCKMIYDALNPLYKRAKDIAIKVVVDNKKTFLNSEDLDWPTVCAMVDEWASNR